MDTAINQQSLFVKELYRRINEFFKENNLSKKADFTMNLKIIFGLAWWLGSYLMLYASGLQYWQFVIIYILQGGAQLYLLLNISHDANHHAISNKKWVNNALSHVLDVCGINSYIWRILHHKGHHYCTNVHGEDEAIIARGIFRFSPLAPKKKLHKFQHLYATFVYGMVSIDYILFKDFEYFFFSDYHHVKGVKHPPIEILKLFLGKIFYLTYMIVLPVVILGMSVWLVLLAFFVTHFLVGLFSTWVFQTTHVINTNQFPHISNNFDHFVFHILATTSDYSTKSPIAYWFLGGLNLHVIHHLYPHVCHTHYNKLTKIIRETTGEYGIDYRENKTMYKALVQHYGHLKQLAVAD